MLTKASGFSCSSIYQPPPTNLTLMMAQSDMSVCGLYVIKMVYMYINQPN